MVIGIVRRAYPKSIAWDEMGRRVWPPRTLRQSQRAASAGAKPPEGSWLPERYPANDKAQLAVNNQAIRQKRRLLRSATPFHGGARGCGRVNGKSEAVT